jgi:hypothetical protein
VVDVHTPKAPIHSVRDFLIEMVTITVGVLIALSFEGLREWNHNRSLAKEARTNIVRELAENKKAVDSDIKAAAVRRKDIDHALDLTEDVLKGAKPDTASMNLAFNYGDMSIAAWQTAEHTGALGHMSYAEVQQFAGAYVLQDLYQTQQRRGFADLSSAMATIAGHDPTTAPHADLEQFRGALRTMGADLFIEEQFARQLSDRYAKVLKEQVQ